MDALVSVSALPDPVVYANCDQAAYWDMSFSCSYVRGVRVEELAPLLDGQQIPLSRGTGSRWSEFATAIHAEV